MILRLILSIVLVLALVPAPAAAAGEGAAAALRAALALAAARDWPRAVAAAAGAGAVGQDVIEWMRIRDGAGDVAAARAFLARRPDWPGLPLLREKAEAALAAPGGPAADPAAVLAFFRDAPPVTGAGARALAAALAAAGRAGEAEAEAVRAWTAGVPMTAGDEADLLGRHGRALARHHAARLDLLLWQGRDGEARRLLPLVDAGRRRLAEARLALQSREAGVDARVAAVPADLAADAGLARDRFVWRMRADRYEAAAELILERSESAARLGDPAAWAERRALLARREAREGDARRAYRIAARHHLAGGGAEVAELEFLAGFVALRRLGDPARALGHFRTLERAVTTPISLARALYWQGRAEEAMGDTAAAAASFARAARHQTAYYGQLAAERAGIAMDPRLVTPGRAGDWRQAGFRRSSVFAAATLLAAAGDTALARRFLLHLAEGLDASGLALLADYALAAGEANWAVTIAKQAAGRGVILPAAYFPLVDLGARHDRVAPELALAIARRESEFDPAVVSPAGARGLMQVMPATAERMARALGLPWDPDRLTRDGAYNARLGLAYLAELEDEFGANPALLAAAYNAGPGRPRAWLDTIGDPRTGAVDPVDWVETVPFAETRSYIMRVVESLPIYRARLAGRPLPFRPTAEIRGR